MSQVASTLSDAELVQQALEGRPDPFATLISRHERLVFAIVARATRNSAETDDLVQSKVAAALDAGLEVIYTGLRQTAEQIVKAALEEDVDAVGLSLHSGAHMTLIPKIRQLLADQGRADALLVVGGIIPADDGERLQADGVAKLFGPGTSTADIVDYIAEWARSNLE